ncbi:hypothetical protein PPL_08233 [Heterostelium album PN500]|uniref:Uncharacterized protein n=1 Tax=Heterostelium pallidum (strain ATCC 26659 / Pp 5 / PN500) TaxID=670386 RepID=D3BIZ8_HETP5|nr:hypothetical protein PPL_08233 [Heterostelium album PN500]EFA78772.1 hypothetical protein PPL_08233 [Heterostelium album PN500]|eukprot:XP_020430896.1 hypothetical protein PPL_08233 [Heterostelium album PN500]
MFRFKFNNNNINRLINNVTVDSVQSFIARHRQLSNFKRNYSVAATSDVTDSQPQQQLSSKALEHKRTRDQVVTAFSNQLRLSIINLTKAANVGKTKHGLNSTETMQLGKMMSGVSLCASFLSDEERISAQIKCGNRNPQYLYAEAIQVGEVRGYLVNNESIAEQEKDYRYRKENPPVGLFQFNKILYGQSKPVESTVELEDFTITTEFQRYFSLSEQVPTVISLEHEHDSDGTVTFNGGILVQSLPTTPDSTMQAVQERVKLFKIDTLLNKEKKSLEEILKLIAPHPIEIIGSTFVDFFCRCSLKSFKSRLITLGLDEIKYLKQHNHDTLNCNYCNKKYVLQSQDFDDMIKSIETSPASTTTTTTPNNQNNKD